MEPFYFNGDRGPLFGVYHAPAGEARSRPGVLLCYPAGSEYENTHRTFVHLAEALASAGLHTLRFDYFGCGDSAGDFEEASVDGWLRDISTAAAQLREGTGVQRIALVGFRLGAALALLSAGGGLEVSDLALCDPVLDGAVYLEELGQRHRARLLEVSLTLDASAHSPEHLELLGYRYPAALLRAIRDINLTAPAGPPARRVLVVESTARNTLAGFSENLGRTGADAEHRSVDALRTWRRPGEIRVPLEIIDTVLHWLGGDHR